jgi:glycosyltransferase involved in cell wall biosynthesis
MELWHRCGKPGVDNKTNISLELLAHFDCVINMHIPEWIEKNWANYKKSGITVVQRLIGQNIEHNERRLAPYRKDGLKIIRYSPKEELIPGYIGGDALIRFYKDPEEYKGWVGNIAEVLTFAQSMAARGAACNFKHYEEITRPFPRALVGPGNEIHSWGKPKVSYAEMKAMLQNHKVFFFTGTWPASYTLSFIEAWMTGIPVVAIGPAKGHPFGWAPNCPLYEIPDLIENGVTGFWSDNPLQLRSNIKDLLHNTKLAQSISDAARLKAISIFGKEIIKAKWAEFLTTLEIK